MEAIDCIRSRMSIRAFKKDPLPRELLTEIIDAAKWSPSYKNSQPWEVKVLSGEKKDALSRLLIDLFAKGVVPAPDLPVPESWPEAEDRRIAHLYKVRAEATGIDLRDPEVVRKSKRANFNFYRAPHVIYLFQEASLTPWSLFDLGLFAQSLMLAAHGAKVVVNDLGGARDGSGADLGPADAVVEEIRSQGGEAVANGAQGFEVGEFSKPVDTRPSIIQSVSAGQAEVMRRLVEDFGGTPLLVEKNTVSAVFGAASDPQPQ